MSRLSKLEAKVAQLWEPPIFWNVWVSDDQNTTTGIDYTSGSTLLKTEETPYPVGTGGYTPVFNSVYNSDPYFTGSLLEKGDLPQVLLRPLEVFPGSTSAKGNRSTNSIYVVKIRCRIMLNPGWFSDSSTWGMPAGDSVVNPAEIILMWASFPNTKSLVPFTTSATHALRDYVYPPIDHMFRNLHQQRFPGNMHRDFASFPMAYASQSMPDSYREWHRGIFTSEIYTGEGSVDSTVPIPFRVLREKRLKYNAPFKEVSAPATAGDVGYIGSGTSVSTVITSTGLAAVHGSRQLMSAMSTHQQNPYLQFIEFDLPIGEDVLYRTRPMTADSGTALHSIFGLCERSIELVVFSNRNSTFWRPQIFCDVLVHGVQAI